MIRVVIADDHALFREGLMRLLETAADIEVVGAAGGGIEALDLVFETKPDLLMLDISMPDMDGRRVAERLSELRSAPRVLFLTMHRNRSAVMSSMCHKCVCGYVLKESAFDELLTAVHAVMKGEEYVSPAIHDGHNAASVELELTERELEVLRLTAGGRTTQAVANELGISRKTVENHRAHIMEKLGAANMVAAVNEATRKGLL